VASKTIEIKKAALEHLLSSAVKSGAFFRAF
jgi:hypothetical protein